MEFSPKMSPIPVLENLARANAVLVQITQCHSLCGSAEQRREPFQDVTPRESNDYGFSQYIFECTILIQFQMGISIKCFRRKFNELVREPICILVAYFAGKYLDEFIFSQGEKIFEYSNLFQYLLDAPDPTALKAVTAWVKVGRKWTTLFTASRLLRLFIIVRFLQKSRQSLSFDKSLCA